MKVERWSYRGYLISSLILLERKVICENVNFCKIRYTTPTANIPEINKVTGLPFYLSYGKEEKVSFILHNNW